nr:hypothetical protein B296_00034777 [Ipomoea batatas]
MADQENAAQSPVLAAGVSEGKPRRNLLQRRVTCRAVDGGALVQRDHRGPTHAQQSSRHLGYSIFSVQPHSFYPANGGQEESNGGNRVLYCRSKCRGSVVQSQQVKPLICSNSNNCQEEELNSKVPGEAGSVVLFEKIGEGEEEDEGEDVAIDGEHNLAHAHVKGGSGDDMKAGVSELQGQHGHVELNLLRYGEPHSPRRA